MKKRFALLTALTVLALSACNFNPYNNSNNEGNPSSNNTVQTSVSKEEQLVNVISNQTYFPEVGDQINLGDYIEIDEEVNAVASQYTFTSSNPSVVEIKGLSATCKSAGFATVTVTGPEIKQPLSLFFYTGSVAGTYVPDSSRLKDLMSIQISNKNEQGVCPIHLTVKAGNYRNKALNPFDEDGVFYKNISPLLIVDFANGKPKDFSPVTELLSVLNVELPDEIPDNVYGLLSYDEAYGVGIKVLIRGDVIEFFAK